MIEFIEFTAWLYVFDDMRIHALHGKIEPGDFCFKFYSDNLDGGYPLTVSKYEKVIECTFGHTFAEAPSLFAVFWVTERDDELAKKIFEAYFESRIAKIDDYARSTLDRINKSKEEFEKAISCIKAIDISNTEVLK